MQVDIWSDVACPWCAVGKHRFETALARFEHGEEVEVRWRSFELQPDAPAVREGGDYAGRLAAKYRVARDQAVEMIERMRATAAEEGWSFDFEHIRPGNTFDAHRLLHLAHDHGVQDAVKERFLAGYFEEGVAIGDHGELRDLAVDAGLPAGEVDDVLGSDRYADAVRADEAEARELGVTGVPFFALDRRFGIPGAQPVDTMVRSLDQAWDKRRELVTVGADDHDHAPGEACADGSCTV